MNQGMDQSLELKSSGEHNMSKFGDPNILKKISAKKKDLFKQLINI